MLKKLMKYEWKAVWRVLLIINAFTAAATLLGSFTMQSLISEGEASALASAEAAASSASPIVSILIFMLYYATIIGVSFAMTIYIAIRFYKNLYTDEGYLMHTLPVTKRQLILSKLLVHTGCMLITGLLVIFSIFVLMLPLLSVLSAEPPFSMPDFLQIVSTECRQAFGIPLLLLVLCLSISYVISAFSGVLGIYCAIALGQTFQKHKVLGSILCYVGITCLVQTITTIALMPQMLLSINGAPDAELNMTAYFANSLLTASVIALFLGIAYYLLTQYLMSKKLNLD